MSQPARAVWIEILTVTPIDTTGLSQPARAVWIEIFVFGLIVGFIVSQPARAVWIEIITPGKRSAFPRVTACEGCVD